MKVLVTGRNGQLARALSRVAERREIELECMGRSQLDVTSPNATQIVAARQPNVVINTAAYTAVDAAESNPEEAFQINATGAGAIAKGAAQVGATLIHVSTDYVFSGHEQGAYTEENATEPLNVYGASKLAGEELVRASDPNVIIVRTAWIYDAQGSNFVRTMLSLARRRQTIEVVADQWGCPTFAPDMAECLLDIGASALDGVGPRGIYHCAGAGDSSRAAFASEIFRQSERAGGPFAEVKPIQSCDFHTAAPRPANTRLDCEKLARDYGVRLRPWRQGLAACIEELAGGGWSEE